MSEVMEKKLSDIGCEFISGFGFKSSDYTNSGIPLIKIGNIQNRIVSVDINGTYVSEHIINEKIKQVFLSNNDVLIAMTGQGSVGRVGRLKLRNNDKALLNQRVGKFVCDEENININYLYYILTSDKYQDYLFNTGAGSGQPNLSPDLILQTEIPWFNYVEQKAIAEVLSSLDDKIDLLHRQNKTLEQMAETLFRQWFVEESKEDWGETISKIPIDIIDGDRGKNYPKSVDFFDEEYCLFLSAKNVTTDGFDFSQKQFITKEKDSQLRKGKLMRGDIILTTRGTVGNFSFYDDTISFDNIRINSGMIILRSKKYDPVLFYNIFKSDYFKKNLSEFISGSAQPQIPIRDFREIMIPFPTEVVINKYLKLIKPLYSKLFKCNKQIHTLEKMRDTLLPKLMSGEVRVNFEKLKEKIL